MDWQFAPDVKLRLDRIVSSGLFPHILPSKITAVRGVGSSSRAIARVWSLPRVWQIVLDIKPRYIIEVITERFDKLTLENQDKTLIHELMHIPKTFSGALISHKGRYHQINGRSVQKLYDHFTSRRK